MYADDSKIIAVTNENNRMEETTQLQTDLDKVVSWTDTWLMKLNIDKCKVMHIGPKNPGSNYTMTDKTTNEKHTLETTTVERDLGVLISADLKIKSQVDKATSQGNRMLGLAKRTFVSRDTNLWLKLYKTYIRSQMEFAVPAWNPYLTGDIKRLEQVQRRATRVAHEMRGVEYSERLKLLGLTTLEERR